MPIPQYILYGAPGRASAAPEAVLEELDVPFAYVEVDLDSPRDATYRALNPYGQVPTLVHGGRAVTEAAAICLYLADMHPGAKLAPDPGSQERGAYYQWMLFLSNTLQPAYMSYIYPERFGDPASVRPRAADHVSQAWRRIDAALEGGPYLLGSSLSTCDHYLFMLSTWHREAIFDFAELPHARRSIDLLAARPAIRRMMQRNASR